MDKNDRLGLGIVAGGALLIGLSYLLFRIVGDSYFLALLVLAGWFVLAAYIIKFMGWMKK
jgi:hypothetical protein